MQAMGQNHDLKGIYKAPKSIFPKTLSEQFSTIYKQEIPLGHGAGFSGGLDLGLKGDTSVGHKVQPTGLINGAVIFNGSKGTAAVNEDKNECSDDDSVKTGEKDSLGYQDQEEGVFGFSKELGPPKGKDLGQGPKLDQESSDDELNKTGEKDPVEENGQSPFELIGLS